MADTATRLSNANQRPGFGQAYDYYGKGNDTIYEAVVVRIGMFENFECSLYISVRGINELIKCPAPTAPNASASTCTGTWTPYFVGDEVLVTFLYGDTSRPIIIGRCHGTNGTAEFMYSNQGLPIPRRGDTTPSGQVVRPSPLVLDPANVAYAGMVSVTTSPMILI